ncbi:MAG: septum formation initiator family protein [Tannerella sp.]|nr:septum formation initiator family protein [Tannerella sp.]
MNKYVLVVVASLIITFTIGDSNLYVRYKYDEQIRELESEIRAYRKEIEENQKRLDEMRNSKESIERYAREEFFMKKPDEDVFIIVDK